MPFTFSHPAAAVPLRHALGRFGVLSALVIGSTTPDMGYFLPWLGVSSRVTHGLEGLFSFCLPLGAVMYLLFHALLKAPCLDLMPRCMRVRLLPHAGHGPWLPHGTSPWGVPVSLLLGAVTHIVWDSFTHAGAPAVIALPVLNALLFEVHGYQVLLFKLLQHVSSLVGLALLAWWGWCWLRVAAVSTEPHSRLLSASTRAGLWILFGVLPPMVALRGTLTAIREAGLPRVEGVVVHFVVLDVMVLGSILLLYSVAWQTLAWRIRPR